MKNLKNTNLAQRFLISNSSVGVNSSIGCISSLAFISSVASIRLYNTRIHSNKEMLLELYNDVHFRKVFNQYISDHDLHFNYDLILSSLRDLDIELTTIDDYLNEIKKVFLYRKLNYKIITEGNDLCLIRHYYYYLLDSIEIINSYITPFEIYKSGLINEVKIGLENFNKDTFDTTFSFIDIEDLKKASSFINEYNYIQNTNIENSKYNSIKLYRFTPFNLGGQKRHMHSSSALIKSNTNIDVLDDNNENNEIIESYPNFITFVQRFGQIKKYNYYTLLRDRIYKNFNVNLYDSSNKEVDNWLSERYLFNKYGLVERLNQLKISLSTKSLCNDIECQIHDLYALTFGYNGNIDASEFLGKRINLIYETNIIFNDRTDIHNWLRENFNLIDTVDIDRILSVVYDFDTSANEILEDNSNTDIEPNSFIDEELNQTRSLWDSLISKETSEETSEFDNLWNDYTNQIDPIDWLTLHFTKLLNMNIYNENQLYTIINTFYPLIEDHIKETINSYKEGYKNYLNSQIQVRTGNTISPFSPFGQRRSYHTSRSCQSIRLNNTNKDLLNYEQICKEHKDLNNIWENRSDINMIRKLKSEKLNSLETKYKHFMLNHKNLSFDETIKINRILILTKDIKQEVKNSRKFKFILFSLIKQFSKILPKLLLRILLIPIIIIIIKLLFSYIISLSTIYADSPDKVSKDLPVILHNEQTRTLNKSTNLLVEEKDKIFKKLTNNNEIDTRKSCEKSEHFYILERKQFWENFTYLENFKSIERKIYNSKINSQTLKNFQSEEYDHNNELNNYKSKKENKETLNLKFPKFISSFINIFKLPKNNDSTISRWFY